MHRHYFEIKADNPFELGQSLGKLFRSQVHEQLNDLRQQKNWHSMINEAQAYLKPTIHFFPTIYDEIQGYSEGAEVPMKELWALLIEDELDNTHWEKCTLVVTNQGHLVGHNEDWQPDAKDYICVLKKQIGELVIFELHYQGTLGGNSISINSAGFIQSINSLYHNDQQIGVPRNIIARYLSETHSPLTDCQKITTIQRASGYHHALISQQGQIWSLECSAKNINLTEPNSPFVHTNHYISNLHYCDQANNHEGTFTRFDFAWKTVKNNMSITEIKLLLEDESHGNRISVFNKRTIGQMIVDFSSLSVHVWLLREKDKGWIKYPLDFL